MTIFEYDGLNPKPNIESNGNYSFKNAYFFDVKGLTFLNKDACLLKIISCTFQKCFNNKGSAFLFQSKSSKADIEQTCFSANYLKDYASTAENYGAAFCFSPKQSSEQAKINLISICNHYNVQNQDRDTLNNEYGDICINYANFTYNRLDYRSLIWLSSKSGAKGSSLKYSQALNSSDKNGNHFGINDSNEVDIFYVNFIGNQVNKLIEIDSTKTTFYFCIFLANKASSYISGNPVFSDCLFDEPKSFTNFNIRRELLYSPIYIEYLSTNECKNDLIYKSIQLSCEQKFNLFDHIFIIVFFMNF